MPRFNFLSIVVTNLHRLILLLAAAAILPGTPATYPDLGDQLFKLLPNDGAEQDWFGRSVVISGATAIVVAYRDDDNGTDSGSAYLFDAASVSPCPQDFNGDGEVGPFDLATLLGSWGPCLYMSCHFSAAIHDSWRPALGGEPALFAAPRNLRACVRSLFSEPRPLGSGRCLRANRSLTVAALITQPASHTPSYYPSGIALASSGRLFVADAALGVIHFFDDGGGGGGWLWADCTTHRAELHCPTVWQLLKYFWSACKNSCRRDCRRAIICSSATAPGESDWRSSLWAKPETPSRESYQRTT